MLGGVPESTAGITRVEESVAIVTGHTADSGKELGRKVSSGWDHREVSLL